MLRPLDTHLSSTHRATSSHRVNTRNPEHWVFQTIILLVASAILFLGIYIRLRRITLSIAAAFCVFLCGQLVVPRLGRYRPTRQSSLFRQNWAMNSLYNRNLAQFKRQACRIAMLAMTPRAFEQFVLRYFELQGFSTQCTPQNHDDGIDGIVKRKGWIALIQCKRYRNPVVQRPVREFLGVLTKMKADAGFFVTTATFAPGARRFACGTVITLIDGETLTRLVHAIPYRDPTTGNPL